MQITGADIYLLSVPLARPFRFETVPYSAPQIEWSHLQTVLVRLWSGDTWGWGEAAPGNGPFWTSEWTVGTFHALRDWLVPRLLRRELAKPDDLHECLAIFRGHRAGKAALDIAYWDLKSRATGRPLHIELGGKQSRLPVGTIIDRPNPPALDAFLEDVGEAFSSGFSRVTVRIRPGWDLQVLNILRHEFPVEDLHGDLEGALTLNQMEILYRFDDFNLRMIEQPLPADDLVGHAMLQESIRTPVCLDESITTPAQADMALELHSAKYFNVNPVRVGGLTPATAIHQAAHEHCVPCYLGVYPHTAIGTRAAFALGSLPNFCYPADFWGPNLLAEDLAEPVGVQKDPQTGKLQVVLWDGPGLGTDPEASRLKEWTIDEAHLR